MCRFLLYLGPELTLADLITRPGHSLVHQSYHAELRAEPLNGDGFGVAWYAPGLSEQPAAFRSIAPAWSNRNLLELCRVTRSACVLAHVRAASPGLPVAETNCHPFVAGQLAFMHNGHLEGFPRGLKRQLLSELSDESFHRILGTTDSEHVFALFLDRYRETEGSGTQRLQQAMRETLARLRELVAGESASTLNLVVSDGESAVVSRVAFHSEQANSLFVHEGKRYVCREGDTCMMEPDTGRGAVIVSSEPISEDPGWEAVPSEHLVVVHPDRRTELVPL